MRDLPHWHPIGLRWEEARPGLRVPQCPSVVKTAQLRDLEGEWSVWRELRLLWWSATTSAEARPSSRHLAPCTSKGHGLGWVCIYPVRRLRTAARGGQAALTGGRTDCPEVVKSLVQYMCPYGLLSPEPLDFELAVLPRLPTPCHEKSQGPRMELLHRCCRCTHPPLK